MVPFEENFDWAHQRKLEKYEDLREQCVRNACITNVFPIEVGCRGFHCHLNFCIIDQSWTSSIRQEEIHGKDPI